MHSSSMGKKKRKKPSKPRKRARRYSTEFKKNAVELVLKSDEPLAEIARRLGIPMPTLHQWRRRHEEKHGQVVSEDETAEEKVRRLEARVALLEEERDILKKATAFFVRESE